MKSDNEEGKMAILRIRKYGEPILRKRCNPVEKPGIQEESILDDMAETMYDANGAGLAAPQVRTVGRQRFAEEYKKIGETEEVKKIASEYTKNVLGRDMLQ